MSLALKNPALDLAAVLAEVHAFPGGIYARENGEEVIVYEGEGCKTLEEAVSSIVVAAFNGLPEQRSLSARDILKRWHWYGVPMPPKPTEDELRAAMVIAAEKPDALVQWANRGREFRNPKDGPTGDEEGRLRPKYNFGSLAR